MQQRGRKRNLMKRGEIKEKEMRQRRSSLEGRRRGGRETDVAWTQQGGGAGGEGEKLGKRNKKAKNKNHRPQQAASRETERGVHSFRNPANTHSEVYQQPGGRHSAAVQRRTATRTWAQLIFSTSTLLTEKIKYVVTSSVPNTGGLVG